MNRKEYDEILEKRLKAEREDERAEGGVIEIVYTPAKLVEAGKRVMKSRSEAARKPSTALVPA